MRCLVWLGLALALTVPRSAEAVAQVVINEVLYDAPGTDTGQEWLELYNAGESAVDLSGWRVERGGTSFALAAELPDGTLLTPGDFLLIGESSVAEARVVTTLVMQNGGNATDGVRLVDRSGSIVDVVLYDEPNANNLPDETGAPSTSFAPDVAEGHSLARITDGGDTNASGADFRDVSIPTPGASNSSSPVSSTPDTQPSTPASSIPAGIVVNEVLPDPVGSDAAGEFIELYNPTGSTADLSGSKLDDAEGGSNSWKIPSGTTLVPGAYRAFKRTETGIAFNNDGDSARLLSSDGSVISILTYTKSSKEGSAWARTGNGTAAWTIQPTPGTANVIVALAEEDDDPSSTSTAKTATSSPRVSVSPTATSTIISIAGIRALNLGTSLSVQGTVSVPVGVLGESVFYITDGTNGVQVFVDGGTPPTLALVDRVSVRGTRSSSENETRVKAAASDIKKLGAGAAPTPHDIDAEEMGEGSEGALVRISGAVSRIFGTSFVVTDSSGEARVLVKESTGWKRPTLSAGTAVTVTGVVSQSGENYRILPRFAVDLVLGGQVKGETTRSQADKDTTISSSGSTRTTRVRNSDVGGTPSSEVEGSTASPTVSPSSPSEPGKVEEKTSRRFSPVAMTIWGVALALGGWQLVRKSRALPPES